MAAAKEKPREWEADTYSRVATPQAGWADETLDRVELRGDERLLDAGCGTGNVTEKLVELLPDGHVIAVDGSADMVRVASELLGDRAEVFEMDLNELELDEPVDVVFSNAVFHWVLDHENLFRRIHDSLVPGGRRLAQCGGHGNIAHVKECIATVASRDPRLEEAFASMPAPWNYATPEETEARLREAGFSEVRAWIFDRPAQPEEPAEFLRTVIMAPYLEVIPADLHDDLIADVVTELGEPVVLDYVRLNMEATR